MIYRIEHEATWRRARPTGTYVPDDFETEGFIHCSAMDEIAGVADAVYHGQADLVLLCIRQDLLTSEVRWEDSGGRSYPHIYGPLNVAAVCAVVPFPCRPDGSFAVPADIPEETG
jgi:uncharacterized protein (DUF952 family)